MADPASLLASGLDRIAQPGRWGRLSGDAGVLARELQRAGLAAVTARNGQRMALAEAVRTAFNADLPSRPKWLAGAGVAFIGAGPERWLVHVSTRPMQGMEKHLAPLAPHAAIVELSDAFTLLSLTGPRVRDALAKGMAIDLDPRAFSVGDAATTLVAHITVQLWQIDDDPSYVCAVPRTLTESFWQWLIASSAEFGLELRAASGSGQP